MMNPAKLLLIALIWYCKSTYLPKLFKLVFLVKNKLIVYIFFPSCIMVLFGFGTAANVIFAFYWPD